MAACNETVYLYAAIESVIQFPRISGNSGRGDCTASGGYGASAAKRSKPDHDFVLGCAGGGAGEEHVVGDVGDERGTRVSVFPGADEGGEAGERSGRH